MDFFCSWEIASKDNKWVGRNSSRWHSDEYDNLYRASEKELDPIKRAAMFIRMNDMAIDGRYIIPIVNRPTVAAVSRKLKATMNGFATDLFLLQDWYKEA
jgi:peptide/nickel transport system substrate-binding protein